VDLPLPRSKDIANAIIYFSIEESHADSSTVDFVVADCAVSHHETMRASRSRTRENTNLLTATLGEAAPATACFLATARDLLCLQLSCRRFNTDQVHF